MRTKIVLFILLTLIGGKSMAWFLESQMIYYPQSINAQRQSTLSVWEKRVENQNVTLHGWVVGNRDLKNDQIILYFGGNAEEVSYNIDDFIQLAANQRTFVLFNYRGYGASSGAPNERNLFSDALAIYDDLVGKEGVRAEQIHVMGRSLGSGVAVYLASQRAVKSTVLVTPFDSLANVAKKHFPVLPVDLLLTQRFDSVARAPKLAVPALFLLAGRDEVVPAVNGEALAQEWQGTTDVVTLPSADHNNISLYPEYWQKIDEFLFHHRPPSRP